MAISETWRHSGKAKVSAGSMSTTWLVRSSLTYSRAFIPRSAKAGPWSKLLSKPSRSFGLTAIRSPARCSFPLRWHLSVSKAGRRLRDSDCDLVAPEILLCLRRGLGDPPGAVAAAARRKHEPAGSAGDLVGTAAASRCGVAAGIGSSQAGT